MKTQLASVIFIFLSFFSYTNTFAGSSDKDSVSKANQLFESRAFRQALPVYRYLLENSSDKKNLNLYGYRLGICSLFKTDQHEQALTLLIEAKEENKKAADISFYLGRAYMLNYKFDDAIVQFTSYLIKDKSSKELKELANKYIENCQNGIELMNNPVKVNISNLGEPINSSASEYVPVISADESILIFTYRGEKSTGGIQPFDINDPDNSYTEDVFMSAKAGGEWIEPFGAGSNINSIDHDACIALSVDGQKLFVFKNNGNDNGDIYMSSMTGNNWSIPERLRGNVNTNAWEGSCSIGANERILYFSSERPGGYGGRDLYKATLQHDGSWGEIKNLGPKINTPLDDDAPFIHPDGTTLLFSSKGHKSMGGYDIFKTFRIDTSWTTPENMGYPINTPGDDIYYVLSADGQRGYYSSEKAGGFGQQDIYTVGPGLPGWKPALVLLKGTIMLNDNPIQADVEILLANNNENIGIYKANASTGKYLISLPAGTDYKVTYRKFGYTDQIKNIANTSSDSYSEVNYDINYYDPLTLTQIDVVGNKIAEGERKGRKDFLFKSIPFDSLVLFKLEGKGSDSIQTPVVLIDQTTHILETYNEKYFCLRNRPVSAISKTIAPEEKIAETSEIPFGKAENYSELVKMLGNFKADGLEYKIQIGAYRSPENFIYSPLNSLGKVSRKNYEDQITRFSVGSFKSLQEADQLLGQIFTKGFSDAFVTAFYKGNRILLRDIATLPK